METLTGIMPTDRPERYAKQLLSHWSERGTVRDEGDSGAQRMDWHDGQVLVLAPREGSLEIEVQVPDGEDVVRFAEVVARHLERFGQRDELVVTWEPAGG